MGDIRTQASEEQIIYAGILEKGTWVGLATLVITFLLYITNILEPVIPIDKLPSLWTMKVKDYMHANNLPHGWGWVNLINHGDFVNFIGIAWLSGLTMICYIAILPTLIKKKDTPFVVMAIVEVLILALAASGILTAGGH